MLIGIDLGTSALKTMLLDEANGRVVDFEREPLEVLTPTPECAEADPETWWQALTRVMRRLSGRRPAEMRDVRGIGLSTIFPALTPLDARGNPLCNALLYSDRRSGEEVEIIARNFGKDAFEAGTANQLTPGTCALPGILWLRRNAAEVYRKTHVFGMASTFLIHRLTGNFVVDYSHAGLSGLVHAGQEDAWAPDLLDIAGLTRERLPRLQPATTAAGELTADAAAALGLCRGIPVASGAGDAPLAALGGGIVRGNQLFVCTGTTDCPMFTSAKPPRNPAFANCRYPLPELWVSIGATSTAGASVKWLCDRVFSCGIDEMTALAAKSAPGAGGVVYLPYLQGERTPWWDPVARGVFTGLTLTADRADLCRAVFEGVAFAWRQVLALLQNEYEFELLEIVAVGGGAANPLWNRIKASVLKTPLRVLEFAETASLGAAMTGGLAAGVFSDAEVARAATAPLRSSHTIAPVPEWIDAYDRAFAVYDRLYPALKPVFAAAGG